jgi:4-amino-4-deoxy-L-arabinose transferase-like glycosyltransferase
MLPGLLAVAMVFLVTLPTLPWVEFSNGIENLNINTVLEMHRGAPWMVPTLDGSPRYRKPPLNAWITAASVRSDTVAGLSSTDERVRDQSQRRLAWEVRLPALLMSCAALIAIFLTARMVLPDPRDAVAAVLVAGTCLYFIRFARYATTDIPLLLFVSVATWGLALGLLRGRWTLGLWVCGAALGLALMSKGPVALVQTVVPALCFAAWLRWAGLRVESSQRPWPAALVGTVLMLLIGGAWFAWVLSRYPEALSTWWIETLRTDPSEAATAEWFDYLSILHNIAPWTILFVVGLGFATRELLQRGGSRGIVMMLLFVVVPIVIMSCFRDRKERYLLPLLGPAAMIVAHGLGELLRLVKSGRLARWALGLHWGFVAMATVAAPLACGLLPRLDAKAWDRLLTPAGEPWFPLGLAVATSAGALFGLAGSWIVSRRLPYSAAWGPAVVVLMVQLPFMWTYRNGPELRSEMRPLAEDIWRKIPDAVAYNIADGRKRIPPDLSIYLNRLTERARSPGRIPPADHAQVYVAMQKRRGKIPEPEPLPEPGWQVLGRYPRDRDLWIAFYREPLVSRPTNRGANPESGN